jgi:hypothetical protein
MLGGMLDESELEPPPHATVKQRANKDKLTAL